MRIPLNWLGEFVSLPKDQKVLTDKLTMAGHMLDKTDNVDGKVVIDLELRGNRADCYSIIGIAREVAALFNTKVKYPRVSIKTKKVTKLKNINLDVKTRLVKRVMMAQIKDVKIESSPKWLTDRLKQYGVAPINNIVDLTNYVMIETGEPMHAFDFDKIGKDLEIRLAKKGEKMVTFLDKTLTLTDSDLVWANKKSVLSVAGAIGGKHHSISNETKNVLLEAASYERSNIRRSIHKHSLLTDAGIRHEKELDPNMVEPAVLRFLDLLEKNKWGKVISQISDHYLLPIKPWRISTSYEYIYSLSGLKIEASKIKKILLALGFKIIKSDKKRLEVEIPTHRTDVTLEEDLIEEILRIYGYENIPVQTLSLEIPETSTPDYINQEKKVREVAVSLGFNEVISSSFVRENILKYNKPLDSDYSPVKVSNRPSPDAEELRMSLFANLKETTLKILNERGTEAYLFEVGKIYLKNKKNYLEKRKLGIIYCQKKDAEFVYFKGYIESLFEKLNIDKPVFDGQEKRLEFLSDFYNVSLGKEVIGYGGQDGNIFYLEIDLDLILDKVKPAKATLWPKYPPQIEDITLMIPANVKIGEVMNSLTRSSKLITDIELMDTFNNSYTFRLWYQDKTKTLDDKEVEVVRTKALDEVKKKFGVIVK